MHNFFGNLGYFERAPFASDVFDQNSNIPELINTGIESQKITSFELGYGLRSQKISANLNVYSTQWNDRTASTRVDLGDQDGEDGFVNVEGVDALHEGLEFDFEWRPTGYLQVKGSVGLGDWRWRTEVVNQEVFNRDQEFQGFVNAIIDDVKVADAAQTTAALGVLYRFWEKTSFTVVLQKLKK